MSKKEITLERVESQEQILALCDMAAVIWHETFDPLLPEGQVPYMLEKFQSPRAVNDQLQRQNYRYYFLLADGERAGFVGFAPRYEGKEETYLSKVYVLREFRGSGAVRRAFALVEEETRREGLSRIRLTVNRHNTHAYEVYLHYGFTVEEEKAADIGAGFVMDDYIMVKNV